MSHKQIYYSDKYDDDKYEYRWVIIYTYIFNFMLVVR